MRKLLLLILILFFGANLALAAEQWVELTTSYPTNDKVNDIYCLNVTTCWAGADNFRLWKTTDRGLTWGSLTSITEDYQFEAIDFPNSSTGYAAVISQKDGYYGGIWKTTDGGVNWDDKYPDVTPYGVYAYDADIVWAVGFKDTEEAGAVWRTTDGGDNWNETKITDVADKYYLNDVFFTSPSTGCAVGISKDTNTGRIWYSENGGENWSAATVPTSGILYGVHGDGMTAWAVGFCGSVLKSTGFKTWSASNNGIPSSVNLYDVYFIDEDNGWVVGCNGTGCNGTGCDGVIYHTTDGGNNWTLQTIDATTLPVPPLYGVHFIDEYNGWAVGGTCDLVPGKIVLKYVFDPAITSVSPSATYQDWNDAIVLTGKNYQPGAIVTMTGGSGITYSANVDNSTQITINASISATASIGAWTITVENPDTGIGSATFTVNPKPTIDLVDPSNGTQGDTDLNVKIYGSGFQSGISAGNISFGPDITVKSVDKVTDVQINARIDIASGAATGSRTVSVTNLDGGTASAQNIFTVKSAVVPNPTIISVSPNHVTQGAVNQKIEITGTNFESGATVDFSSSGITIVSYDYSQVDEPTEILNIYITVASTAPPGERILTVTNNPSPPGGSGSSDPLLPKTLLFITEVGAVNPTVTGAEDGYPGWDNEFVYINGTGFKMGDEGEVPRVLFNPSEGITMNWVEFKNEFGIRVNIDIDQNAQIGPRDITVVNPDGGYGTGKGVFEIVATTPKAKVTGKKGLANPNPWNPGEGPVTLQFKLTRAAPVALRVWAINGMMLQEFLINGKAGYNKVVWGGNNYVDSFPSSGMLNIMIVGTAQNDELLGKIKLLVENKPR